MKTKPDIKKFHVTSKSTRRYVTKQSQQKKIVRPF